MVCKIVFLKLIKLLDTIRLKHLITALFKFNYAVLSPEANSDLFTNIISTNKRSTPCFGFFITLRDFFGGWWEGVEEDTVSHKIRDFGNWTRFENKTMTR